MWFFRSDYNTKISSLEGISSITANQEFFYLPIQKMTHVSTFNSICYFKGQSFKVMLPSHNFSQLSFKPIYRCTYKHTHLFTCTNKSTTFSLTDFDHFISFSIWFKATYWITECTDPTLFHQGSPGGLWELSVKLLVKLPQFIKHYFCNQGQKQEYSSSCLEGK